MIVQQRRKATFALTLVGVILAPSIHAESFVIHNARVFDGKRAATDTDVWVEGETIKAIGNKLDVPDGVKAIDGRDATLLPGFIDAHTHTYGDALKDALIFGVTTE